MAVFVYSVRDKNGKVAKGKLEGPNKDAVQAKLTQMGYIILELDQQSGLASLSSISIGGGRVDPKSITIFARQFSTMINAGLPLVQALDILAKQSENKALKDVTRAARQVRPQSSGGPRICQTGRPGETPTKRCLR